MTTSTSIRLSKQIDFLLEIDSLKNVLRQNLLVDGSRRENTAEHSWHIAVLAIILHEYSDTETNLSRIIKMLLVHDLVEIYAGDSFAHDESQLADQRERELEAADKLFSILPEEQGKDLRAYWEEFDARKTADAKFANVVDRVLPFLQNLHTASGSWKKHSITREQEIKRMYPVAEGSKTLWEFVSQQIDKATEDGLLKA
ncbi:MAG: HD domain-containing protein [Bdellovibrionota bacterium]